MVKMQKEIRDIQKGSYLIMDDAPCEIIAYSTAKPGKHGSAKARIEGKGVFDNKKRSMSQPVDAKIWVPVIERRQGQVINLEGNNVAQVMDLNSYESFSLEIPGELNISGDSEIEYLEYEDQRKVVVK
ncbi:MAG TPA: translation initiation factor IF-5A [Halobacteriales archaeon]|uniref:translation initiation factor IF-5A n=1 Tax=Candidatus Hikarchaeum yamanae TaxID=2675326 RepID=UPI0017CAEC4C|nr:translation initiation factor IF-5A [Halobacteriales archaeon]|tara:strand:- start:4762 stop:5145 length:384 start_codon:yes stop_codon:yes gene_type:complete